MNISKLNRITHRDIGYLIAGLTIIYAISGITLNHKNDWNPNYIVDSRSFKTNVQLSRETFNDDVALNILSEIDLEKEFKASHFPTGNKITLFINGGYVQINTLTGEGVIERISKRPLFYGINLLHYNPGLWWKYFSDMFCLCLILVTITGLFLVKGRNGITRRGAVLTITGIVLPLLFLLFYS
ncbi:MAG TPA: PepSY-associated TM helix domain-containing protein [Bacteroidales bacterium]|nr:PepSY-associated TM helix domain-containing protein [Bacteroidales bacterium]